MRRLKNYTLSREPFDNPEITYRDRSGFHNIEITAGNLHNADIEVFRENEYTYVLSWNQKFPYVGLEKFLGHESKEKLFLHKREAIEEILGKKSLELTPMNMVKKLSKCLVANSEQKQGESRTFEIHLEDLKEEAQRRYLELVKGEPMYGPLAILEIEPLEEEKENG